MNITVISGSPKGSASITLKYIEYLQLYNPNHHFQMYHVGQQIGKLEKNRLYYDKVIGEIETADCILWATPVYYMLVPAQLKRFIELIFERDSKKIFTGKAAAALTTSIHFYDHTAVRYLQEISEALEMVYTGSYTAEMHDLFRRKERNRLDKFMQIMLTSAAHHYSDYIWTNYSTTDSQLAYVPGTASTKYSTAGKTVTIISDSDDPHSNLAKMVDYFSSCFTEAVKTVNLAEAGFSLGCRGCLVCGDRNRCYYEKRDNFHIIFEENVIKSDILIIAGTIRDRFLSSRWKLFFDRSFYMNHVPYLKDKQIGFIISGPLKHNPNLRDVIEALCGIHQGNLAGIVSDEADTSADLDAALEKLVHRINESAALEYLAPKQFLTVGGRKIFRDFIAGPAQITFPADYRYYRQHNFFDYPQRLKKMQLVVFFLRNLLKIPRARKEYSKRIIPGLVQPYEKFITREKEKLSAGPPEKSHADNLNV